VIHDKQRYTISDPIIQKDIFNRLNILAKCKNDMSKQKQYFKEAYSGSNAMNLHNILNAIIDLNYKTAELKCIKEVILQAEAKLTKVV
jgi:hypothetical protein